MSNPHHLCRCSAFGCDSHTVTDTLWNPPKVVPGRYLRTKGELATHAAADAAVHLQTAVDTDVSNCQHPPQQELTRSLQGELLELGRVMLLEQNILRRLDAATQLQSPFERANRLEELGTWLAGERLQICTNISDRDVLQAAHERATNSITQALARIAELKAGTNAVVNQLQLLRSIKARFESQCAEFIFPGILHFAHDITAPQLPSTPNHALAASQDHHDLDQFRAWLNHTMKQVQGIQACSNTVFAAMEALSGHIQSALDELDRSTRAEWKRQLKSQRYPRSPTVASGQFELACYISP